MKIYITYYDITYTIDNSVEYHGPCQKSFDNQDEVMDWIMNNDIDIATIDIM